MNQNNRIALSKLSKYGIFIAVAVYTLFLFVFAYFNVDSLMIAPDSNGYIYPAKSMIAGDGFRNELGEFDGLRTPGYPLFLAIMFMFKGNLYAVIAMQLLFAALSMYLVYRICILMNLKNIYAFLWAIVFAIDITVYIYSCSILSDAFFMNCIVVTIYFLVKYLRNKKFGNFVLFIVFLNYSLAVRPILMYYNTLLCLFVFGLWIFKKVSLKHVIVSVLAFVIVFGGWSYRNYLKTGVFEMSYVRNYNMINFDGAMLMSRNEGISVQESREKLVEQFNNENPDVDFSKLTKSQKVKLQATVGKRYIKNNFVDYIFMNIKNLCRTRFGPNLSFLTDTISNPIVHACAVGFNLLYYATIYFLFALGWLLNFKKSTLADWFLLTIAGYCMVASASVGYARFRLSFFVVLIIGTALIWKDSV